MTDMQSQKVEKIIGNPNLGNIPRQETIKNRMRNCSMTRSQVYSYKIKVPVKVTKGYFLHIYQRIIE